MVLILKSLQKILFYLQTHHIKLQFTSLAIVDKRVIHIALATLWNSNQFQDTFTLSLKPYYFPVSQLDNAVESDLLRKLFPLNFSKVDISFNDFFRPWLWWMVRIELLSMLEESDSRHTRWQNIIEQGVFCIFLK